MDPLTSRVARRYLEAVIRKEKGEYCVRSPKNKSWSGGCFDTKDDAEERLREVEVLKHLKKRVAKET
jgi:hypothetical protein